MRTRSKRIISALLSAAIALGIVSIGKNTANADIVKEIDLYSHASTSTVTIPSGYRTSYQITISDLGLSSGEIYSCVSLYNPPEGALYDDFSTFSVRVTKDGLVTPACWYWKDGMGYSDPPADFNYTSTTPITGTAVVRVYLKNSQYYDIVFHHYNYDSIYADKVIDDFIAKNITSGMSVKEIVTAATKWAAESFDYGNTSSAYSMIISGYGDCWASTDLICTVCTKCGLKAWARNANKEPGAGSGHMNAIIEDPGNGVWYIGEAGYSGKAPRKYSVYTRTTLYCYRTLTSQNGAIELYQIDADNDTMVKTTSIKIPSVIEGYTVTSLGASFMAGNTAVHHISIPDTVKTIGNCAFYNCSSLSSIEIPSGVTSIGTGVFYYCENLKSIKIPSSVTSIGKYAFCECNKLTDIYYEGSESDWNKIVVDTDNEPLSKATVHYGIAPKTGWEQANGKWKYYDLGKLATGWQEVDNNIYYFDNSGIMQTGWLHIDEKWYYCDPSGHMKTGWMLQNNKWYYFDPSGKMLTGLKDINGSRYYFSEDGMMLTGWQQIKNKWYYFSSSGKMQTGWLSSDKRWYYLDKYGYMLTGWNKIGGGWFYFNGDGSMVTGWKQLSGKWYYFDKNGFMLTGWQVIDKNWYYLTKSGDMVTGWQMINGYWYYFSSSGRMETGWHQSGSAWYYLNELGRMVTGTQTINGKQYIFDSNGKCTNP